MAQSTTVPALAAPALEKEPIPIAEASNRDSDPVTVTDATSDEKDLDEDEDTKTVGEGSSGTPKPVANENPNILTGMKLFLAFFGMLLSVFLIALDQTIIAPALPVIASKFDSLDLIGWTAAAYFITQVGFLLLYGQFLVIFNRRYVFIAAIAWFELGSLLCGVAPNMIALIIARAIAGIGAAGIFTSVLSIISDITRLEDRPALLGSFGAVFAVSSVAGPLLGGVFTDHASWRWCFYINLPIGAITILSILFVIPNTFPPPLSPELVALVERKYRRYTGGRYVPPHESVLFKIGLLDFVGSFICVAMIVLLVLPLQWGGTKYAWDSGVIIGTLCGFAALVVVWLLWEWKGTGGSSIFPLHYFRNPTQIGTSLQAFLTMNIMLSVFYFLPIWYQGVRLASATRSGIDILPTMMAIVVAAGGGGALISKTGRYWPFLVIGPVISSVGCGLLYTINETTSNSKLIGYQILAGGGLGLVLQNVIIAIQATVPEDRIPQATSLVTFFQLTGGVIGIAIAQTLFNGKLASALHQFAPDAPFDLVRFSVSAVKTLPPEIQPGVIHAYSVSLRWVFIIGVVSSGLSLPASFLVENKSIKGLAVGGSAA